MLLWVLRQVDPGRRTSLGKHTSSFLPYRRGSPAGPRGGRYPSIPIKPPSCPGWARPQPEWLALVALSPLLPPAPDKCVISGCSLMETSRGGCQWDKYSSAFLLSCGSSGWCGLRHRIWMPPGRNKIYRKKKKSLPRGLCFMFVCFVVFVFKTPPQSFTVCFLSK